MKLEFIALDKLSVSTANMRYARKAPDVSDILPTIAKRGILQPLIVRPHPVPSDIEGCADGHYEILGGARRYHAALIVAAERTAQGGEIDPVPCAILDDTDDAAAVEASLIENLARLDPDEVTQWATFTRLVKEGRKIDEIAATFGLPDAMVRRILALGNLLPRIRALYARDEIDAATVRHLTMATKAQQRDWLAMVDDPEQYAPRGSNLKSWLFGGQTIPARHALFGLDAYSGQLIADLFGEDRYFAEADQFWTAQHAEIAARRSDYLEAGWREVIVLGPSEHFYSYDFAKAPKRKGGRVYVDVRGTGEVVFHEGYVSRKEAQRLARGESADEPQAAKPPRPEITATMQRYCDLHRHAAVRAALLGAPQVALRLMVAHAIAGSSLFRVAADPRTAPNELVAESAEIAPGETLFDEKRRAVLGMLDLSPDEPTLLGGNSDGYGLVTLFQRLLDLPESCLLEIVTIVMGEALGVGSPAIDAVGLRLDIDLADWWQADEALFECIRDRDVLTAIVHEVAGATIASANAKEKAKTLKRIIRDHLDGEDGRTRHERWVPRWMAFPPSAYTDRGGVGTVIAHATVIAAIEAAAPRPEPEAERLAA